MLRLTRRLALCAAVVFAASSPVSAAGEKVLVFGGTGRLGSDVVKALRADGWDVTVFARPSSDPARLGEADVSFVEGDVLVEADVERALKSAQFAVVVDALARGDADPEFYDASMKYISSWAAKTGVGQVILHGSVGAGDSRAIYPQQRWDAMKVTLLAKDAGEKHLMNSGVTYTIIRNAVLRDMPEGFVEKAVLYEDQSKFGGVTRPGLARLTAECAGNTACFGKIYHAVDAGVPVPNL